MMLTKTSNALAFVYALLSILLVGFYVSGGANQIFAQLKLPVVSSDILMFTVLVTMASVLLIVGANQAAVIAIATVAGFIVLTINQHPLIQYLTLAAVLFSIGAYGMVVSRNTVRVLMSIELMLNAVNINLVAFARYVDPVAVQGQVFAIFILTVAAAEAAVGLAIVLAIYRNQATVDMDRFNLMKW